MQGLQEEVAFAALEAPIGTPPFEQFAQGVGQFGQRQLTEIACDLANEFELLRREWLAAEGQAFPNVYWHSVWPD
jgi:hypothetical protein